MSIERLYPNTKERTERITNIKNQLEGLEITKQELYKNINTLILELNILQMMDNLEKVESGEIDINILAEQQNQK